MVEKAILEKKIGALDWGIIFAALIMMIMVYIPQIIWEEENKFKSIARHRMTVISNAEEFYFELTGKYTMNGEHLIELVEAAMDSLLADSLFLGEKLIHLSDGDYQVNVESEFEVRVDTTFSEALDIKVTTLDTIYSVGMSNEEDTGVDTIFINANDLMQIQTKEQFVGIFSSDTITRSEIITDYLRNKYHLSNKFLNCPITNVPYVFEIDEKDEVGPIFTVTSPVPEDYKESRFGIFKFKAGRHGNIRGGVKSWSGN